MNKPFLILIVGVAAGLIVMHCNDDSRSKVPEPAPAVGPCDGRVCGESCSTCPPDAPCPAVEEYCDVTGLCTSSADDLRCGQHLDCLDKRCGDSCVLCEGGGSMGGACPSGACNAIGECIPDWEELSCDSGCDDGPVTCEQARPGTLCGDDEVVAVIGGCWECVNPLTCAAWGEPTCETDADCENGSTCDPCGTSSCSGCKNCVPACVP